MQRLVDVEAHPKLAFSSEYLDIEFVCFGPTLWKRSTYATLTDVATGLATEVAGNSRRLAVLCRACVPNRAHAMQAYSIAGCGGVPTGSRMRVMDSHLSCKLCACVFPHSCKQILLSCVVDALLACPCSSVVWLSFRGTLPLERLRKLLRAALRKRTPAYRSEAEVRSTTVRSVAGNVNDLLPSHRGHWETKD